MKKHIIILMIIISVAAHHSDCISQWTTVSIPFTGFSQMVFGSSFINAETGFVGVNTVMNGNQYRPIYIFQTTNKGLNWISRGNIGSSAYSFTQPSIFFINENTGFVTTIQSNGNYKDLVIYKTINGCNTYTTNIIQNVSLSNSMPRSEIIFTNENTGFITTTYHIYKTTNAGINWYISTNNNPNDPYYIKRLAISKSTSNVIYAGGGRYDLNGYYTIPVILKSSDGGNSFFTIVDGSYNGILGMRDICVATNNSEDVIKFTFAGGVAEYSNGNVLLLNSTMQIAKDNYVQFWDNARGVISTTIQQPSGIHAARILLTTDGGYTWDIESPEYGSETNTLNKFNNIGDIFYTTSYKDGNDNANNTFFHFRKINVNLFAKSNYQANTPNITMTFDGYSYSPLPYYGVEIMGGYVNNVSVSQYPQGTEDVFYKWNNNNMSPSLNFSYSNAYYIDKGDVIANYKSKLISTDATAITNVNQTKSMRDELNQIHQVHSSMGGIFYSISYNNGSSFSREEVVNGGADFIENHRADVTNSLGNKNPSLNLIKYFQTGDLSPNSYSVVSVWERYNQPTQKNEILCALRTNAGGQYGIWKRFGLNSYANEGKIITFNSVPDYTSKPDVFAIHIDGEESDVRNFFMLIPHLEPSQNGNKLVVSARYKNYTGFDFEAIRVEEPPYETNDFVIVGDNVTDYSVTYKPYLNSNNYKSLYLYFTYKKNGNIYYRRESINITSSYNIYRDTIPPEEREYNVSSNDNQTLRNGPDITLRNNLPAVTYQGRNDVYRIVYFDGSEGEQNIQLHYYPILVKMRDANGNWLSYNYNSNGFQTQENPDIEGSVDYDALLINFSKASTTFYQFAKINGLTGYSCSPGYYPGKDAKLIKGSYIGQFGTNSSPGLLTLSNPVNSLYSVGRQLFVITNAPSDGYSNMDGTIEKENILYTLTLGPIIASNTTQGFEDDAPPQTVQNAVEFNETMVSAPFTLSNNDTLILGAHGKYLPSFGQAMEPMKYHVNLVDSATNQIHSELFSDTINVEDSVGIEFLRGFVINNISGGTGRFYVQLLVDTADAGDGDYMMAGVYSDNTLPGGDAPINYKTKVFFKNSSNSLKHDNQIPKSYELSQNYPNPFNPVTKINYALPKQGFVTLKIYDITGREVKVLVNEFRQAGYYTIDFNGSNLASGVYFYRIQSNDFIHTKRMVLIK